MYKKTLSELSIALKKKQISSTELTQLYLDRIKSKDSLLNSFITLTEEIAILQAKQADRLRAQGVAHPLLGIPIAHKDIFCIENTKTSCASKMLDNFIAPYTATIVQKMNDAGCITLGKLNMDEFAMGSSSENSCYGPIQNPWQLGTVPGGSSGGSAAAVAARLIPGATGTDTGGSIRQPAALCGISGLKPTYGRVSRFGIIAFASSLDQAGPMAQTAEDLALLMQTMAGFDPRDSTSVDHPVPDYSEVLRLPLSGLKIGIPQAFFKNLDAQVAQLILNAKKVLESQGATCLDVALPNSELSIPAYYVLAPAEAASNLARFDGVRYGYRCDDPKDLFDLYGRSRGEAFGPEVKRRILVGTYVLSSGHIEAFYLKAQKIRQLIANDFKEAFAKVDVILSPTTPDIAFSIGEKLKDPVYMYQSDQYTISINMAGLPAISIPCGFKKNMPVGMQFIGNYFDESRLLQVAHQYQLLIDWHKHIPKNFQ